MEWNKDIQEAVCNNHTDWPKHKSSASMFWFFVLYFAVGYVLKPGEIVHKKGMTIIIIILPKVQVAGCS